MRISRKRTLGPILSKLAFSITCAAAIVVSNPGHIALQDMSAMIAGLDRGGDAQWKTYMTPAGAGSIHKAEAHFDVDPIATGSLRLAGEGAGNDNSIAITADKAIVPDTPDEARVNRSQKAGRIAAVVPIAPPKAFNAGSIVERQSFILRPSSEKDGVAMVFAKPEIKGEEIEIATAFHLRKETKKKEVTPMIASLVNRDTADVLATAYAPTKPSFADASPFDTLLKEEPKSSGRFIPPAGKGDHSWVKTPLPASSFSSREQKCLAEGIYFEARGENKEGQAAVAQVILNRVRNPTFPNTICGVVYQNKNWRNRCQFSFACDGIADRVNSPYHWKLAQEIALATSAGKIWLDSVGSSTHYHATYVSPNWAPTMKRMTRIGLHVFYRTYNGGWS